MEDCLKLLRGERDEQRFAGLLLVTKYCKDYSLSSLKTVYEAVGPRFLERLLRTGLGKGVISSGANENREAYLQLSVIVLAAFSRVPEIAASDDMVSKIPLILEVMSLDAGSSVCEECLEFLCSVSASSDDGVTVLYEAEGMKVLASSLCGLPDGSRSVELAMELLQLMLSKLSLGVIRNENLSDLATIVAVIARQFALLHNALKFNALQILAAVFSSPYSVPLHAALQMISNIDWAGYLREGVVAILQNRVAPADKFRALIVAESAVRIIGEQWFTGQTNLSNAEPVPSDRCLLLVLETSRVEASVLLNELAYTKYEASKSSSTVAETIVSKQENLTIIFSLVEKIIKLISNINEGEGHVFDESSFTKVIAALNETIGVVLDYLQDAKEHGQRKGIDLLASVRVVGSYLAETPIAFREKVSQLLDYMLSVESEEEASPFYSVCFLLPMLCQMTMETEGCKLLASCGGCKAVVECLIKLILENKKGVNDTDCVFLACDIILNLLLKREISHVLEDKSTFFSLLKVFPFWAENSSDQSVMMMASSIVALILDFTSEDAILSDPNFGTDCLISVTQLLARSLASRGKHLASSVLLHFALRLQPIQMGPIMMHVTVQGSMLDVADTEADLLEIVTAGYSRWADRFPQIKAAVERYNSTT